MTAVAVATLMVLFGAASAGAADYPPSQPLQGALSLVPTKVAANGMVDYNGTGCGHTQPAAVAFNGSTMTDTMSDAGGAVSGSFRIPSGTAAGDYSVAVSNTACSLAGTVTVLAENGTLPHTGSSNTIPIVLSALAAVVVGLVLVAAARRRRLSHVAG